MSERSVNHSYGDRAASDLAALEADAERDSDLETGTLRQGCVSHLERDRSQAIWTGLGGVVLCRDETLAEVIAAVINEHVDDNYDVLVHKLDAVVGERVPGASCRIDIGMYCCEPRPGVPAELSAAVGVRRRDEVGMSDLPESVEHVFVIEDDSSIVSWASNIPVLQVGDHWIHSVGVGTDEGYRRRGYARAVTSAIAKHVADEGGATLWVCEANNVASFRLGRSVGYLEHHWVLNWRVPE